MLPSVRLYSIIYFIYSLSYCSVKNQVYPDMRKTARTLR